MEDIEKEYEKLLKMGVEIIEKPMKRPWGATSMGFYDIDKNVIYFRCFTDWFNKRSNHAN